MYSLNFVLFSLNLIKLPLPSGGIIMLPTGGVAGVSVFASKVFGNFALAATADVFVSTSLSEGTPMPSLKKDHLKCNSYWLHYAQIRRLRIP